MTSYFFMLLLQSLFLLILLEGKQKTEKCSKEYLSYVTNTNSNSHKLHSQHVCALAIL